MNLSPQQIHYYAWDLTHRRSTSDDSKFVGVLSEAKVDLNPHQIEAALFAFHSPLSKGAILADEVGLGKTIEAGIILSQFWAEHKRQILIIVPASLRNQWSIELMEKFYLPSTILEKNKYEELKAKGKSPLQNKEEIIICSYQFFVNHADEFKMVMWDLVVMDEAHKLRNVYQKSNVIGNVIKNTLKRRKKLLLTATPLQNNLKELYGLVSIVDDDFFTSPKVFSERYNAVTTRDSARYGELRSRLIKIIHRTLRKQVKEYVNYTKRSAILENYTPSDAEQKLYDELNNYLQRDDTYGIPEKNRALLSLLLRKIMGSSAYALSFTLEKFIKRLKEAQKTGFVRIGHDDDIEDEDENDEIKIEEGDIEVDNTDKLDEEIKELESYRQDALDIKVETKAMHLLKALEKGFIKMHELGAQKKALIFTESRRTQEYLKDFLSENGYANKIVCFNGTNNDEFSKDIYHTWLKNPEHINEISGNSIIDRKQALVDYFKTDAEIMIATEAGAEGINLQFCSLVVNYDMPWNPQRIEQRIGRCHRYGQKFDVVVINFVNESNQAEKRTYELLKDKFNLFDGVFGSSDEVLGSLESGVDFEKRLNQIYQNCRTKDEIQTAFDQLQSDLEDVINDRIKQTKKFLIENFDEDVIDKLKIRQDNDAEMVSIFKRHLWNLALTILGSKASNIDTKALTFDLSDKDGKEGKYTLSKTESDAKPLRLETELGKYILDTGKNMQTDDAMLTFDMSHYRYHLNVIEQHIGESGTCVAYKVHSDNKYDGEEKVMFCCTNSQGEEMPEDFGEKLMELSCVEDNPTTITDAGSEERMFEKRLSAYKEQVESRSNDFVNDEIDKLTDWVDEMMTPLEDEIRDLEHQQRTLRTALRKERNARNRIQLMNQFKEIQKTLSQKRDKLRDEEERYNNYVDQKQETFEKSLENNVTYEEFFRFKWHII